MGDAPNPSRMPVRPDEHDSVQGITPLLGRLRAEPGEFKDIAHLIAWIERLDRAHRGAKGAATSGIARGILNTIGGEARRRGQNDAGAVLDEFNRWRREFGLRDFRAAVGGDAIARQEALRIALFTPPLSILYPASTYIRILGNLMHPSVQDQIEVVAANARDFIERTDEPHCEAALVQRNAIAPELTEAFIRACRERNVPMSFELDDDLLDPASGGADVQRNSILEIVRAAKLVTVSTEPLREIASRHNARVAVVPNKLNEMLWTADKLDQSEPQEETRAVFIGSYTHAEDLDLLRPAFERLREKLNRPLTLEVVGGRKHGPGCEWFEKIPVPVEASPYPHFVQWLRSMRNRWTFAVAPLTESPINRAKSGLKYLEYAALGLPAIYSRAGEYPAMVRNDQTGLLVENTPEAWETGIRRLCEDQSLRSRLRSAAFDDVVRHHTIGTNAAAYFDLLRGVIAPKGGSRA